MESFQPNGLIEIMVERTFDEIYEDKDLELFKILGDKIEYRVDDILSHKKFEDISSCVYIDILTVKKETHETEDETD
jgi:hypothetical protein